MGIAGIWAGVVNAEAKVGEELKSAGSFISSLLGKVNKVAVAGAKFEPEIAAKVEEFFADLEALVPELEKATTEEGINLPADSAVYGQIQKLVADYKALTPEVDAVVAALKTV